MAGGVGVELSGKQEITRARLNEALARNGGVLPMVPDGPRLEEFAPLPLAQALEFEVNRCAHMGWDKITLHMTPDDAMRLSRHLRAHAIMRKS